MANDSTSELALASASTLPLVKIDREKYLREELKKICS